MRLLQLHDDGKFSLAEYLGNNIPRYAILSHTWGSDNEEVTYQNLLHSTGNDKIGFRKLTFCGNQAKKDGLQHFWVDTCCIDKSSSAELSEAINSMFRWYQKAERCYVYMADVSRCNVDGDGDSSQRWKPAFRQSRWFTRGWTLQELIAPGSTEFFCREETYLGNKRSLEQTIHEITGIAIGALRGDPLSQYSIDERLSWGARRKTKREEDEAYCLLGILGVYMSLIYGEGQENAFARLEEQTAKISKTKARLLSKDEERILLASLRFDQINARQMTIENAHPETCNWLLNRPEYLDWLNPDELSKHHGFLWIKGKPGAGKSTLMKFAHAHARRTATDDVVTSFFFNARGQEMEKSTVGAYRSLLLQLLDQRPGLQKIFNSLGVSPSSISADYQWRVDPLKLLLGQAIQSSEKTSVVCFIDALDECEERQIRDMILFFERVGELAVSSNRRFKVCLSSRHYPHITIRKGVELVLEGQEGHSQDITNYVKSELRIGRSKIAEEVRIALQEKASGIFMWVVLVVGILNKEYDSGRVHALQRRLQEIPSDLHDLFRDILTRDAQNRDELVLCIQWLLFAEQPLSPEELYFAILAGVEPKLVSSWDHAEITIHVIKRFILDSSKGLAEITASKLHTVQFIHESIRDFLLKENGLGKVWPDLSENFRGQSHEKLKQSCFDYMSVDIRCSLKIPGILPKASTQKATNLRKSVTRLFPFMQYAVRNVLRHADTAAACSISQSEFLDGFPLSHWIMLDNLFENKALSRHSADMSLLYLLGERNMINLIRARPCARSCLDVGNGTYGPPLFAAMATGSVGSIEVFVRSFGVIQYPEENAQKLIEECCQSSIGSDFRFSKARTILSYSAEFGFKATAAFLLKCGEIDIDSKDKTGRTPLWWAVQNGHEDVVKQLIDTGKVSVDANDSNGHTPLWRAANQKHAALVQLLLETGQATVGLDGKLGQEILFWAAQNGLDSIVQLLVNTHKVDVDLRDEDQRRPLAWAARGGHHAVVKVLLQTGKVNLNAQDMYHQTPLWLAMDNDHSKVAELLLRTGKVDVEVRDLFGHTPLYWAKRKGYKTITTLLQFYAKSSHQVEL